MPELYLQVYVGQAHRCRAAAVSFAGPDTGPCAMDNAWGVCGWVPSASLIELRQTNNRIDCSYTFVVFL